MTAFPIETPINGKADIFSPNSLYNACIARVREALFDNLSLIYGLTEGAVNFIL